MSYHAVWNLSFLISVIVLIAFFLSALRTSDKGYRQARVLSLVFFAFVLLCYAFISSGGLFVFGGRIGTFEGLFYLAPLISPFLLFTAMFSVRLGAILMWVLFAFLHGYYSFINWPSLYGIAMAVRFDWPVLVAALVISVMVWQDKRRSVVRSGAVSLANLTVLSG